MEDREGGREREREKKREGGGGGGTIILFCENDMIYENRYDI